MTDKEFKRLNRAQLIEIIYQLQLQVDMLTDKNNYLEKSLQDKRLRIKTAGNIAEAALKINDCFQSAQDAADQYLNEIKEMLLNAEMQEKKIIADAEAKAALIIAAAEKKKADEASC